MADVNQDRHPGSLAAGRGGSEVAVEEDFTSGRFRFAVAGGDQEAEPACGVNEDFEDEAFDLRLTRTGKVPALDGAPIASWILARLARLTGGRLGLAGVEHVDGGGYVIELLGYRIDDEPPNEKAVFMQPFLFNMDELGVRVEPERVVARFQFQASMEGAAVLGERDPDCPAEELLEALAAALLAVPDELMSYEVAVRDPEWKLDPAMYVPRPTRGSRNSYGWDGSQFLGKTNIREAP
jgi:hypothetical protein